MGNFWRVLLSRWLFAVVALGVGLLMGPMRVQSTWAGVDVCRDDPVIALSDGSTLVVSVTAATAPSNVSGISYTVHVPQGLTVQSISYTGDLSADQQPVQVVADELPGRYDTYLTVASPVPHVLVSNTSSVNGSSLTVAGLSNQIVHAHLVSR